MMDPQHIRSEDYVQVQEGDLPPESLALRIHDHLLSVCPTCATTVERLGSARKKIRHLIVEAASAPLDPEPGADATTSVDEKPVEDPDDVPSGGMATAVSDEVPDHHLGCFFREARLDDEAIDRIRAIRRRARKETWKLQQVPPERRIAKIRRAISQYRQRATAEFLLERCRELVHDDPAEAASLATLVPEVLQWIPGAQRTSWTRHLTALSGAWHGNAVRVAGDLPNADRVFADLRHRLAREPIDSNAVLGEIHSLEASLRIDQRRFEEAEELLDAAVLLCRSESDESGLLEVRTKLGHLMLTRELPHQAVAHFQSALPHLERPNRPRSLHVAVVTGLVLALCDVERHAEAAATLHHHVDLFEDLEDLHAGVSYRGLQGRIAVGQQRFAEAEDCFRTCRDWFLSTGRTCDAALAGLGLAEVYLRTHRLTAMQELVLELLPVFRSGGVPRESLVEMRLLVESRSLEKIEDALGRIRRFCQFPDG